MIWTIYYSAEAKQDLREIHEYISDVLMAPAAAANQMRKIMEGIRGLEDMPMRHRLYEEELWHSQGLRFLPVGNYLVFYLPDETSNTVSIIRIMYCGRDVRKQFEGN